VDYSLSKVGLVNRIEYPVEDRHGSSRFQGQNDEWEWAVPPEGLSGNVWDQRPKPHLTSSKNATLPIALMVVAPELYPTRSKAMRAIRYVRAQ
jgi:hypothetical protein